jgi:hypothetical protein
MLDNNIFMAAVQIYWVGMTVGFLFYAGKGN